MCCCGKLGAFVPCGTRLTRRKGDFDHLITNQLLYRLSYISIFTFGVADLILTNQLLYRLSYISIFTFGVADLILTNQLLYVSIGNDEII